MQLLQALAKRGFHAERVELYNKAFWSLACLRRAHDIQPHAGWPTLALEQRRVIAEASALLLTAVGGTTQAKASISTADEDNALEQLKEAVRKLRDFMVTQAKLPHIEPSPASNTAIGRSVVGLGERRTELGGSLSGELGVGQPAESLSVSQARLALLRVFTNGIVDNRIEKAAFLLTDSKLNANQKLTEIHALISFPPTASAEQLGEMLGVTKQAVLKTDWWIENRKGEKESEVGRRRDKHHRRAKTWEAPNTDE